MSSAETVEKMQNTINLQAKQLETFRAELESLRRAIIRVSQFPKHQLLLLKKHNGITSFKEVMSIVMVQGYPFGLLSDSLVARFKGKSEVKVQLNFDNSSNTMEIRGKILQLKCGIAVLELRQAELPKGLFEHCLILDGLEPGKRLEAGTKIVTYMPGLEIITGFLLNDKPLSNGELQCQLKAEKPYGGSLIFDEDLLPIGVCAGMNNAQNGQTSHIEVAAVFPLTIRLPTTPYCKVLGMEAIFNELLTLVQAKIKQETGNTEPLEDERCVKGMMEVKKQRINPDHFEELDEAELEKAKDFSLMEEFIELDSEANKTLKRYQN